MSNYNKFWHATSGQLLVRGKICLPKVKHPMVTWRWMTTNVKNLSNWNLSQFTVILLIACILAEETDFEIGHFHNRPLSAYQFRSNRNNFLRMADNEWTWVDTIDTNFNRSISISLTNVNKKAVLSQRWPRDALYISRSWGVAEIWPFEIIQDGGAILNLFESKIAPLDPPSPKTPP